MHIRNFVCIVWVLSGCVLGSSRRDQRAGKGLEECLKGARAETGVAMRPQSPLRGPQLQGPKPEPRSGRRKRARSCAEYWLFVNQTPWACSAGCRTACRPNMSRQDRKLPSGRQANAHQTMQECEMLFKSTSLHALVSTGGGGWEGPKLASRWQLKCVLTGSCSAKEPHVLQEL